MEQTSFIYNNVEIPFVTDFINGNPTMINATKMAQCFPEKGKDAIGHFLENQTTKDYINALSRITGLSTSQLLVSTKGNSGGFEQGTWMYEDLAIEFARWLSPDFSWWCNERIDELLSKSVVELKKDNKRLQKANTQLQDTCKQMTPHANYGYDLLKSSKMTYSTEDICNEFSCCIPVQEVYHRLEAENIVSRHGNSNSWFLKAPYDKMGCTRLISEVVYGQDGKPDHTENFTKWTEAGRLFLESILLDWGVITSTGNP